MDDDNYYDYDYEETIIQAKHRVHKELSVGRPMNEIKRQWEDKTCFVEHTQTHKHTYIHIHKRTPVLWWTDYAGRIN